MIVELGHVQDESNINCKRKTFPIPWPHGGGQRCFKDDYKNLILYSHTYIINLHEVLFYIFNGPFDRGGTHIAIHRDILKGIKPQKIYTTFTVVEDKLYTEK